MEDSIEIKATLSSKNQLTVPKAIRDALGLSDQQDKVVFQINDDTVTLKKDNDFWDEVREQEQTFGNLSTNEFDWGPDVGDEVIPK